MKTKMNRPAVSKINWTALAMALVGLLAAFGVIPNGSEDAITEAVLVVGGALVMVWRTWFTEPRVPPEKQEPSEMDL